MQNMYAVWFIIFYSITYRAVFGLGDLEFVDTDDYRPCKWPSGVTGKCIIVSECLYAQHLLQSKQIPQICGFAGRNPLVCCLEFSNNELESRFGSSEGSGGEPGELSKIKCNDFNSLSKRYILGGEPSLIKEFPHMAVIGFGNESDIQWQCGGSLISNNFVLTAAHCLGHHEFGNAKWVRLGDFDLSSTKDETETQEFAIKRNIQHPDYKRPSRYHDIGLIELDREVKFTDYVSMACLDTEREHKGMRMIATGWGVTQYNGDKSNILRKAILDIVPHETCSKAYEKTPKAVLPNNISDDYQICAGGTQDVDTCQGDSGGPLQIRKSATSINSYNIVGITSFGKPCGLTNSPGVYTRVFNYLSWIEDTVWPSD